jgi:hypothetical protein
MLGSCEAAFVEEAALAQGEAATGEAVTVGRVHEASGKTFGGVPGLGLGRKFRVVEGASPDCPRRTLTQKILDLTVAATQGEDRWNGFGFVLILPSSRW